MTYPIDHKFTPPQVCIFSHLHLYTYDNQITQAKAYNGRGSQRGVTNLKIRIYIYIVKRGVSDQRVSLPRFCRCNKISLHMWPNRQSINKPYTIRIQTIKPCTDRTMLLMALTCRTRPNSKVFAGPHHSWPGSTNIPKQRFL